jgi:hypothetical protein
MEFEAMEQAGLSQESGEEASAAFAPEYWIPGCAGMTSEYGDEVGGYGEGVSHISSNML